MKEIEYGEIYTLEALKRFVASYEDPRSRKIGDYFRSVGEIEIDY